MIDAQVIDLHRSILLCSVCRSATQLRHDRDDGVTTVVAFLFGNPSRADRHLRRCMHGTCQIASIRFRPSRFRASHSSRLQLGSRRSVDSPPKGASAFAVAPPTTARTGDVTIGTNVRGHTARPTLVGILVWFLYAVKALRGKRNARVARHRLGGPRNRRLVTRALYGYEVTREMCLSFE